MKYKLNKIHRILMCCVLLCREEFRNHKTWKRLALFIFFSNEFFMIMWDEEHDRKVLFSLRFVHFYPFLFTRVELSFSVFLSFLTLISFLISRWICFLNIWRRFFFRVKEPINFPLYTNWSLKIKKFLEILRENSENWVKLSEISKASKLLYFCLQSLLFFCDYFVKKEIIHSSKWLIYILRYILWRIVWLSKLSHRYSRFILYINIIMYTMKIFFIEK